MANDINNTPNTEGPPTKLINGKIRLDLLPVEALEVAAMAFADGINSGKYQMNDWRVGDGRPWNEYYGAALRHTTAWWKGEDDAQDSKVNHLGHAMACLMILYTYQKNGYNNDNRWKYDAPTPVLMVDKSDWLKRDTNDTKTLAYDIKYVRD